MHLPVKLHTAASSLSSKMQFEQEEMEPSYFLPTTIIFHFILNSELPIVDNY